MKHAGRRWALLLTGMLLGAAFMAAASSTHFVYTSSGLRWVPRVSTGFTNLYVDVRTWTPEDWSHHPLLAQAVARSEHRDILPDRTSPRPRRPWLSGRPPDRPAAAPTRR